VEGRVIMYADSVTDSMERAITETYRRREIQQRYNQEHGITPQSVKKEIREILEISTSESVDKKMKKRMNPREREAMIAKLTAEMRDAAKILEFEHAAYLRDKIQKLREEK
jgi:excinuclease ABC subunit B